MLGVAFVVLISAIPVFAIHLMHYIETMRDMGVRGGILGLQIKRKY